MRHAREVASALWFTLELPLEPLGTADNEELCERALDAIAAAVRKAQLEVLVELERRCLDHGAIGWFRELASLRSELGREADESGKVEP